MAIPLFDVAIANVDYEAFAAIDFADEYLGADVNAAAWRAATADAKGRDLVTATRILKAQDWRAGVDQDPVFLIAIQEATAELAAQIEGGLDASNSNGTPSNVKRIKAGSVEQEFFQTDPSDTPPLPVPVWRIVRRWIDGGADIGLAGSASFGTGGCSITERPLGGRPARDCA
jgi:hypothetical protein